MNFGISSACFYPLETERSLKMIGEMGVKKAEIFFNSPSELSGEIFREIVKIKDFYSMNITSVHPCTSSCETLFFFSEYERRFYDYLDSYKRYFEACAELQADALVIHGMKTALQIPAEKYFERFKKICAVGREYGVKVSQENVFDFVSGDPGYLRKMKQYLKDDFHLIFDVKQMRRCGYCEDDFLNDFIDDIVHVHISDSSDKKDCLPPGEGSYDMKKLLKKLDNSSFCGTCLIELYRWGYDGYEQLKKSYDYLCSLV